MSSSGASPTASAVSLPGRRATAGAVLALGALYYAVGYQVTIEQHVVVADALARLADAYAVWHDDPARFAAVGFEAAPLPTLVLLPFTVVKPVATSLVALPLSSAAFAAGAVVMLDRTLARCGLPGRLRWPLLALFAVNPLFVFAAGNGMGEALGAFLLAGALYAVVSWAVTDEPRFLLCAGIAFALLVLTRPLFLVWAGLSVVLVAVVLARRGADRAERHGSLVALGAPVVIAVGLWSLCGAVLAGDPFGWLAGATTSLERAGLGPVGGLPPEELAWRLVELTVVGLPLALLVVPALIVRGDAVSRWLAGGVIASVLVVGGHALLREEAGLLVLRDALPAALAAVVGAGWLIRGGGDRARLVWASAVVLLGVHLVTAWNGMQTSPSQSLDQAFVRAVKSGEGQEGTVSRGGYPVGIDAQAAMAAYVNRTVTARGSVLVDSSASAGVILLSGRPELFVHEGDRGFRQALDDPFGRVEHLLIATAPRSGDIIRQRYARAAAGTEPGLTLLATTDRYALVRVARSGPR